jgi:hypothetical protein
MALKKLHSTEPEKRAEPCMEPTNTASIHASPVDALLPDENFIPG